MIDLNGKYALVTGGGRGIGKSIAIELAKNNASVCITGRNAETLKAAENELKQYSKNSFSMVCDVRSVEQQMSVFEKIKKCYGRLDICIPNAGEATLASATETSLENWKRDIDTNLTGLFITSTEALKMMKEQKNGNIIGIVSKAGTSAFLLRAAYCASKWGARGFLKCLAIEAKNYNVKVTSLCPASVATDFQKNNPAGMDWMMSAQEVAAAVIYILNLEDNAYIDELVLSTWMK
ncbi:SDR family NAD(P)-dependent oxidoreductase [Candidatus Dependentiae bacterium]|nr:SDR family NAD(P)-dependent oxidoreductase [Candidatus Dependentiae bacterium]